jgi:hypothetical protein
MGNVARIKNGQANLAQGALDTHDALAAHRDIMHRHAMARHDLESELIARIAKLEAETLAKLQELS